MNIRKVLIIIDYKGFFCSKQKSYIYRGGMDIPLLLSYFKQKGFEVSVTSFSNINFKTILEQSPLILYTSSEDKNGFYKSYIEDIIFQLEESGIFVIPAFKYLKAHDNKVAMELLRISSDLDSIKSIKSRIFGTIEELIENKDSIIYPAVIKSASGSMSKGVAKADTPEQLVQKAKIISSTHNFTHDLKEILRSIKYKKEYVRESFYRKKFIVQNMIPGLLNDWKVLVYGNRCYALYRGVRDNDFRASGSGKFEFRKELPEGMLDFAYSIKEYFNVPNISLDIGFDGEKFHLIEFQFLYFGTKTLEKSQFYFERIKDQWIVKDEKSCLEEVYVKSVINYINNCK